MATIPASRVNYFDRQHLRLAELRDEQAYHIQLRRRHNLSHHSWGIVVGLEITTEANGRLAVEPGLAVDGYGRELLLLERRTIGREEFDLRGTLRLDVWLEYRVEGSSDPSAPFDCDEADGRSFYRATERAAIVFERAGGAPPDPRHPPGVPADAFADDPMLATPDEPGARWPVYLGRLTMTIPATGSPTIVADTTDRVYVGLNAAVVDHPGNAARMEIGLRPAAQETRSVGGELVTYADGPLRDFGIFVPARQPASSPAPAIDPTIAVEPAGTQIRGDATIHGNLVLDGTSLQFAGGVGGPPTSGDPALYRVDDELRLDLGAATGTADRKLVIGAVKDGVFVPALEVVIPGAANASQDPYVVVTGDLRVEGVIDCPDVRVRTVTEEVAAMITGLVQAGIISGP